MQGVMLNRRNGEDTFGPSRGRIAVMEDLPVATCIQWAEIGPIEVSGDYLAKHLKGIR